MRFLGILLLFFASIVLANATNPAVNDADVEPPAIGNFALPYSQQPGPLFTFGQITLGKDETQLYLYGDKFVGEHQSETDLIPAVAYGLTDNLSLFFNVPVGWFESEGEYSSGLEDAYLQLEYAYYNHTNSSYSDTGTFVTNMTYPTGSTEKNPPTGYGSPTFFLGTTFMRTYVDWYGFVAPGAQITTQHDGVKYGNNYLYEGGLGRNIFSVKSKWIFDALLEVDGTYTEHDRAHGEIDPDSGGNVVYLIPSLWLSGQHVIYQAGIGFPVIQHLNGEQNKNNYVLVADIGWTL